MSPTPAVRLSAEQDAQVEIVLKELEVEKKPRLRVMNKIDLLDDAKWRNPCSLTRTGVRKQFMFQPPKALDWIACWPASTAMIEEDTGQPRAAARPAERREDAGDARSEGADLFASV